jgi:Spy/CpxP family protein refolding chaperone
MFTKKTFGAAVAALVLMSPLVFTSAALRGDPAPAQTAPQTPTRAGRGLDRMLQRATVVLDLTDTQVTQIRSVLQQSMQNNQPLMQQARQARQAMVQAVEGGQTDATALKPLADQVGQTVSQLALARAQTFGQVYALLTPAQREKANQLHALFAPRMGGRFAR